MKPRVRVPVLCILRPESVRLESLWSQLFTIGLSLGPFWPRVEGCCWLSLLATLSFDQASSPKPPNTKGFMFRVNGQRFRV